MSCRIPIGKYKPVIVWLSENTKIKYRSGAPLEKNPEDILRECFFEIWTDGFQVNFFNRPAGAAIAQVKEFCLFCKELEK